MLRTENRDLYSPFTRRGDSLEKDIESMRRFLEKTTFAEMNDWAADRTHTFELNNQAFRMVVDRPAEADEDHVVVVGGEFGNGVAPAAVARARVVRDLVAPEATLVYAPNSTLDQPRNVNLSPAERTKLRRGNLSPMIGRLATVLEDNLGGPSQLSLYGPSQGGAILLGYAADRNTPAAAVGVIEAPNVEERSPLKLATDFLGSGAQLKDVVKANYVSAGSMEAEFGRETIKSLSAIGLARFGLGLARQDNLALAGILRRASAEGFIIDTLNKGGSVVHTWGTENNVSPREANEAIARSLSDRPGYLAVELTGRDHSITNDYLLSALTTRKARSLR